jgi:hypothetical protein
VHVRCESMTLNNRADDWFFRRDSSGVEPKKCGIASFCNRQSGLSAAVLRARSSVEAPRRTFCFCQDIRRVSKVELGLVEGPKFSAGADFRT